MLRNVLSFVAGGAMLIASTAASAEVSRTSAQVDGTEEIAGSPWVPWVVGLIAALAIVLIITDNDDDEPESP